MRIQIKRSGGFAGIEETLTTADSTNLPVETASQLRQSVDRLSTLCAQSPASAGADRFQYEIEISEPGTNPKRLTVIDEGDPEHPALQQVMVILKLVGA